MLRGFLFLLCSTVALGQAPPREPFDIAVQSSRDARASGNFDEAATRREEARRLLEQTPLNLPQFMSRVQVVAQIFQSSGRHAQARAVVQDALSRANSLGESHPIRIQLLGMLADFWQQDGNLLKALSYREKAVAALDAAPLSAAPDATQARLGTAGPAGGTAGSVSTASRVAGVGVIRSGDYGGTTVATQVGIAAASGTNRLLPSGRRANDTTLRQQLADLYRQLGRPEAAAKVVAKMRSLIQDDPRALAASYEREGNFDEAVAVYKRQSEQAVTNPQAQLWDVVSPLQSLAMLYQREQRWADAAAALDQAIGRLEASDGPEARDQAVGMRLNLANLLQQAGQGQAAERVYQTLLVETANDRNGMALQVLQAYANHLSNTNRADQGEELLKSYLANHAGLQPWQETNVLFSLSQIARKAGQKELADEYQRAATEKQRAARPQEFPEGQLIAPDLQKAQAAVGQSHVDEAVNLALGAIASASFARDRDQVAWQVPAVATALASRKAPERGEQLYHELLLLLQTWSVDNAAPLIQGLQQYARFLISQKDRWAEVPAVIERYRENLVAAQGAETGQLEQALHLRREFALARGSQGEVTQSAEELLALEESLSGTTSAPYMDAAQTAANVYQSTGNVERALALYRQIVAIADLTLPANEAQRGFVRMNAAFALAKAGQFDEAERLANEAVSVGERLRPPQANLFPRQLDQIRRMKTAAESGVPQPDGAGNRGVMMPSGKWFDTGTFRVDGPPASPPPPEGQRAKKDGQQ